MTRRIMRTGTSIRAGLFGLICVVLVGLIPVAMPATRVAAASGVGAGIYIAGDVNDNVDIFNGKGTLLGTFDSGFTVSDALAVGDVADSTGQPIGDGIDEILIAGDATGTIDIFDAAGVKLTSFSGDFTISDGFAVGDVNGDGTDEILVAGDVSGDIDIFNATGVKLASFDGDFTIADGFAVGDVNGDGTDEILVAGDFGGDVDIFNMAGTKLASFDGDFTISDGFAVGDVNGDHTDEILIAGDVTDNVDIFNMAGTKLTTFDSGFTIADGFAVGDIDGDGTDEILIAGDVTDNVDIFNMAGTKLTTFDSGFTIADGFAVGRHSFPDQDGDGLLDNWETSGLDLDHDGTPEVDLPTMGANPQRKDLFLEIDCLVAADHSHCPQQGAIQAVVQSFADAPVINRDGTTGIQLHVDIGGLYGQPALPAAGFATSVSRALAPAGSVAGNFGNFGGGGNLIPEASNLIVDWDGASGSPATNFLSLKASNFNSQRDFVFRYAIFVHQTNARAASNDCTSGWAKGSPGVNLLVSLGGTRGTSGSSCWTADPGGNSVGSQSEQAGALQHEFGHTLGLGHGGGDAINNKPNYLSVMNYSFQACGVTAVGSTLPGGCDYSRIDLPDLNEVLPPGLDECLGIGGGLGLGSIDWDGDGVTEGVTNCQPPSNANVSANINGDFNDSNGNGTQDPGEASTFGTLTGFDDWSNISYGFRTIPNFQSAGVPIADEPDPDTIAQARASLSQRLHPVLDLDESGPASAVPGDTLNYSLKVKNSGHGPALNAVLTGTRPDSTQAAFNLGTLTLGAQQTRNVSFSVPCSTADGTVLQSSAAATGQDMLGNPVSGSDSVNTTVHAPVLTLAKTATASVNAGEAIAYTITYQNTGSGAAANVVISDTLPADVYYSKALDLGAGPKPDSVTLNADGTRTLRWNVGAVASDSGPRTIAFTARPTLLALQGTSYTNRAALSFQNANGCVYQAANASASTSITVVPPTRDPTGLGFWRNHSQLWLAENLARIQATDQRYDSNGDGALSASEVAATLAPGGNQPKVLLMQLLSTYFNLATRRINAGTTISSKTAQALGLNNVRGAALFAADTLRLPVVAPNRPRYDQATDLLDEINNNKSEVY